MRYFLFCVLSTLILFVSCSPQKRIARIVEKNPELVVTETVTELDTIVVPVAVKMPGDTTYILATETQLDTVYQFVNEAQDTEVLLEWLGIGEHTDPVIEGAKIEVRTIEKIVRDTIEVPIECEVEVERVVVKPLSFWDKLLIKAGWFAIPLGVLLLIFLFRKRKQK